jgi:hypothetical protein
LLFLLYNIDKLYYNIDIIQKFPNIRCLCRFIEQGLEVSRKPCSALANEVKQSGNTGGIALRTGSLFVKIAGKLLTAMLHDETGHADMSRGEKMRCEDAAAGCSGLKCTSALFAMSGLHRIKRKRMEHACRQNV